MGLTLKRFVTKTSSRPKDYLKKDDLKNFAKFTGKNLGRGQQLYLKGSFASVQLFSCEYCKIFKTAFIEHFWATAYVLETHEMKHLFKDDISLLKVFL